MDPAPAPAPAPAQVALVEDHELLAAALETALRAEGFDVIRPALESLAAIEEVLVAAAPDVALLDLDLDRVGSGADLIAPLAAAGAAVLIVSANTDEAVMGRCLSLGAAGWVPKTAPFPTLLEAILDTAAGRPAITGGERRRLIDEWRRRQEAESSTGAAFGRLSRREAAVLGALMEGHGVERIAAASFVSPATVRSQVRAVLTKLGVNSQLEAVAAAVRAGWSPPGP